MTIATAFFIVNFLLSQFSCQSEEVTKSSIVIIFLRSPSWCTVHKMIINEKKRCIYIQLIVPVKKQNKKSKKTFQFSY